jgi:hypothetical protein
MQLVHTNAAETSKHSEQIKKHPERKFSLGKKLHTYTHAHTKKKL